MRRYSQPVIVCSLLVILCLVVVGSRASASPLMATPVGTAFTYQGQLKDGSGNPITASCDFQFSLYDAVAGGSQVGTPNPNTLTGVTVTNGYFTITLDFGAGAFPGDARWLEVAVRCPAGSGTYTTLTPRQALTAAPYASYALKAGDAGTLGGVPAAGIPPHGSYLLGAPGDANLTGAGYQALGISNVVCNGCDGFVGGWLKNVQKHGGPSARREFSTVWTGHEMIIWGGFDGTNDVNTGYRYDPSTDTWTAISRVGAPSARDDHTAVWTGSQMIVWGGRSGSTYYQDGGRYNPSTDTWTTISMTFAPGKRALHNAVWTGTYMVIFGGYDGTSYFADAHGYNAGADQWYFSWIGCGAGCPARASSTMVWSGTNIIVYGGENVGGAVSGGFWYNPYAFTYNVLPAAPVAGRWNHSAVWTGNDMIIWGGYSGSNDLNDGARYNEAGNSWSTLSASPLVSRDLHAAVWTGSDMILWGGRNGSTYYGDGARYNPVTNTWTTIANGSSVVSARAQPAMVWTSDRAIVWGGLNGSGVLGDGGLYGLFLGLYRHP